MTEQLCKSYIKDGKYDSIIIMMLQQKFNDETILHEMMRVTKGHENPKFVKERIEYLKLEG